MCAASSCASRDATAASGCAPSMRTVCLVRTGTNVLDTFVGEPCRPMQSGSSAGRSSAVSVYGCMRLACSLRMTFGSRGSLMAFTTVTTAGSGARSTR